MCEFSDGREGKKRRGGHWRWEGYGVPRGWGTVSRYFNTSNASVDNERILMNCIEHTSAELALTELEHS